MDLTFTHVGSFWQSNDIIGDSGRVIIQLSKPGRVIVEQSLDPSDGYAVMIDSIVTAELWEFIIPEPCTGLYLRVRSETEPVSGKVLISASVGGAYTGDGTVVNTIASADSLILLPDKVNSISGNIGTSTFTLQVPNDTRAHTWEVILTTSDSPDITFTAPNGTIYYQDGFSWEASTTYDVIITGFDNKYYLKSVKFI